ncbi:Flp family type IVb pilin [uncultured Novosphingobium sp.]|uniref:Flp family type IVb pilin n=1 Tax=uncultured Novosphingobium sp. TaxID=292277 RepID=UPI0025867086|nr:Flp family type IVb pilin [uncultured Novosphingobium sp.]
MTDAFYKLFARLAADDRGLTAVEYAVLGAIVVAAIVAVGTQFETGLDTAFKKLFNKGV